MKYYGISDKGIVRKENQDCFSIEEIGDVLLLVVCDGMGGHAAGRLASHLADEAFRNYVRGKLTSRIRRFMDTRKILQDGCREANSVILQYSEMSEEYAGLGTTLVGGIMSESGTSYLVNVGDSRAYQLSAGRKTIVQITEDHSLVQTYVNAGLITKEEARTHPRKNIITRALGGDVYEDADIFEVKMQSGDMLLFGSDGLSNFVTDDEILQTYLLHPNPEECCRDLLSQTYARGAGDNVTIAVVVKP
jgi:protein phosphatase